MKRITCLVLCFVLVSLCSARASRKLSFRKRVDRNNVPHFSITSRPYKHHVLSYRLVEGDISVPMKAARRNARITEDRWTDGVVPVEISNAFTVDERETIINAMSAITESTNDCIRFVWRDADTVQWVNVFPGPDCHAVIGKQKQNGPQDLSLAQGGCIIPGTITHELLHALGFAHENTRPDADQNVKIYLQNVIQEHKHNFDKLTDRQSDTFGAPYDFNSIMHYPVYQFTANGKPTMLPIQPVADEVLRQIGHGTEMDAQDIRMVMRYYGCA